MCLATPVKIKSKVSKSKCQIENGDFVDITLVPDAKSGDWLLCHANLAINKIEEKEAKQILKLASTCHHKTTPVT
jgi:hydrogenase assembly chaperone HypC/HupF